ncbi:MAG: helix-turn-helix domain-containing protein [bacterium]
MPRADRSQGRTAGESTRSRILAAAAALFTEHGYSGTSIRGVARSLGLSDPAVHYYFNSKQALYEALLEQPDYGPLPLDNAPLTYESLLRQVTYIFNWWADRAGFGRMLLREQLAGEAASVGFLAGCKADWDRHVAAPLEELFGSEAAWRSDVVFDVVAGQYWDAILAYGETASEVMRQPYFSTRLAQILRLAIPEGPGQQP